MPTIALTAIPAGEIKRAPLNVWATDIQAAVNGLDGANFGAGALAATHVLRARVSGDSEPRLAIQADGKLLGGSGAAVGDVSFQRGAAGIWTMTGIALPAGAYAYGTSLPASAIDGQEFTLVDSLTAPTYTWRFRYNAGSSSSYKWEFVGGSPLSAYVEANESTASTSPVDLTTVGPSVTAPRAGEYRIGFGGIIRKAAVASSGGRIAPKLGSAATADLDGCDFGAGGGTSDEQGSVRRELRLKTLAASDVVKLQYLAFNANAVSFQRRELAIIPIRVS